MTHPGDETTGNEDVQRVAEDVSNRLEELGIWLSGSERPEELVNIVEAVEQFERAVQTRGGDLMVDEGPDGQTVEPDDIHFALPPRRADESVEQYLVRLTRAREEVLLHPPRE